LLNDSTVLKDINPGQTIRFPVEKKPRFKPLLVENWKNYYLVSPVEFGGLEYDHMH